jgi:hypothetical protein
MTSVLPALLVALYATWSGTFHGGASALGALLGDVALLGFVAAGAPSLRDPLRLGRGTEVLLWALAIVVAASAYASPVPRAAVEPVVLFPACVLLPAAVARLWRNERRRRAGVRAIAVVVCVVAAWALADAALRDAWPAAAPLGHRGALGLWFLVLLPFAAATAGERGGWRVVGVAAATLGVAGVLATRSLVATVLVAAEIAWLAAAPRQRSPAAARTGERPPTPPSPSSSRWPSSAASSSVNGRGRRRVVAWALVAAALIVATQTHRLIAIARGEDSSTSARIAYLDAGISGVRARPALGWGPGSVGWTVSEHLRPRPGANPPGEVVSYLHLLPLDLAYQVGVAGAMLSLAVVITFLAARRRERDDAADPALLDAAWTAVLVGFAGLCLVGFPPIGANVVALLVAAGAALALANPSGAPGAVPRVAVAVAAGAPAEVAATSGAPAASPTRRVRWVVIAYVALAIAALAPLRWAQREYERARVALSPTEALDRAVRTDSAFPLYRARRAWASASAEPAAPAAAEARHAAEAARGVAALWLGAGLLGMEAGAPWSDEALARACDLDPLGALAPFRLALLRRDPETAAIAGARALLSEPRLAAATAWRTREALFDRALEEVRRWPGIAPRFRARLAGGLASLPAPGARVRAVSLELDGSGETSVSLFVFRRLPWRTTLDAIDLDADRLRGIELGSAAVRQDTETWAFPRNGCGRGTPPRSPGG